MRVQNEGTGKSSWWMLNPDAKPGKSVRRRAASMETSKFEKRRGRVKKRVEQIRNGVLTSKTLFSILRKIIFSLFNTWFLFFGFFIIVRCDRRVEWCQFVARKQCQWGTWSFPRKPFAQVSIKSAVVGDAIKQILLEKSRLLKALEQDFSSFSTFLKNLRFDCDYSSYSN